jgi:F-type H+-transporting ATPase subunit gamma
MAGTKEIKRRISSVKNTKKITKAMELVAASKMKRAVNTTMASRLYAKYSWEVLTSIATNVGDISHPFFDNKETGKTLLVLITSNRGLCGAYNAQIIKTAINLLKTSSASADVVTIGKKGGVAMGRIGQKIVASFTDLPDNVSLRDIVPISNFITAEYAKNEYEKVFVGYTDFISALNQKANIKQILPVSKTELKDFIASVGEERLVDTATENNNLDQKTEYVFEGNKNELISALSEKLIRMQMYQMLLESNASEQSARMMAMKNASDASSEMIDDLTLAFNKARQANITREISEISAGMASVQ